MSQRTRKNLRIKLIGADGRMGKAITALIRKSSDMKLSDIRPDVVIEFSSPQGLREAIQFCVQHKLPLVSGTTGITPQDRRLLKTAAKKIPILYAANMSLGVAVLRSMLHQFGRVPDWKFQMEEIHHTQKKDKPSGTAKMLAEELQRHVPVTRLPIRAIRRGKVPGTHQIEAIGPDEEILIRHIAHDRRIFARGAIRAARWLFDKGRPGLYDLPDLYEG